MNTTIPSTAAAVAILRDAYPRQEFPDASVRLYVRMLDDLPGDEIERAVVRLIRRSRFLPSVAEIREEVAEARCSLPTPAEAWSLATDAVTSFADMPEELRDSIRAVGGRFTILHGDNPATIRAQFMRDYEQRRQTALTRTAGADGRTPVEAMIQRQIPYGYGDDGKFHTLHTDGIPHTESMPPRPVWARWLRRQTLSLDLALGELWAPPTDEEKHDAILVLRDTGQGRPTVMPGDPLHAEAQRIMDEASL